jgi:hypothetical protein
VSIARRSEIPSGAERDIRDLPAADGGIARVKIRYVRYGDLVDAYPASTHDRELVIEGAPELNAIRDFVKELLITEPRCRRVVFPVPEGDLEAIRWAEDAGFRFVVNVETRVSAYSLLVVEPEWVLAQPQALDRIPVQE